MICDDLFRLFLRGAQENDCYTVHDLCRKMGIPYEQVLRRCKPDIAESGDRARSDYQWADLLEACRERCLDNVEMAAMMKRMKFRDALKYMDYAV